MSHNRPENPELDDEQMTDLRTFFKSRSKDQLEQDLIQLKEGLGGDPAEYSGGGVPANVMKAFIAIKDALKKR